MTKRRALIISLITSTVFMVTLACLMTFYFDYPLYWGSFVYPFISWLFLIWGIRSVLLIRGAE